MNYGNRRGNYMVAVGGGLVCDATDVYSLARQVNHSCEPNCRLRVQFSSGWPCLRLFSAGKPIEARSELTIDYNFQLFPGKSAQPCFCGASKCRGSIGSQKKSASGPTNDRETTEHSQQ
ncbi:uncharacterized protein LMH87_007705 [Akanthomyces muscarius]|uniref:Post-SET domain-containing protein n=1 Tax=Akanthomyces muscarius TaxID=2231603 RepID=A0A9W8URK3_AKAMU|nr:uncharacterized protein LMH87_007705 [Akanthomyces muscarius]KAJ4161680.1 hypothetical protein LMH87_007705 [Akanthomyces muscarius]